MTYSILNEGAETPCSLTCENGKTATAEPIYDDQLTDGLLTYQFAIQGEDAVNVTISSVKCYQTGSGRTETLSASGSVTLLLKDKKTGGNTFTVTAASGSESYIFTFDLPYKHRGENKVVITANLKDGAEVTNEEMDEKMAQVDAKQEKLAELREKLAELRSVTACPHCGKPCGRDDAFCSACGKEL